MARVQTPPNLRRDYETIYLVTPTVEESAVDRVIQKFRDVVSGQGGKVVRMDNWGSRRLAYPIQDHAKATYIYMQYLGTAGLVAELERTLRLDDSIIRFMTVLVDDDVDPEARPEATTVTKRVVEDEYEEPRETHQRRGPRVEETADEGGEEEED